MFDHVQHNSEIHMLCIGIWISMFGGSQLAVPIYSLIHVCKTLPKQQQQQKQKKWIVTGNNWLIWSCLCINCDSPNHLIVWTSKPQDEKIYTKLHVYLWFRRFMAKQQTIYHFCAGTCTLVDTRRTGLSDNRSTGPTRQRRRHSRGAATANTDALQLGHFTQLQFLIFKLDCDFVLLSTLSKSYCYSILCNSLQLCCRGTYQNLLWSNDQKWNYSK